MMLEFVRRFGDLRIDLSKGVHQIKCLSLPADGSRVGLLTAALC